MNAQARVSCLALLALASASSAQQRLSAPLPKETVGDVVSSLVFSPAGDRVAFSGDLEINEVFGVYVSPSDGSSSPVRVSELGSAPGFDPLFSADGQRILYALRLSNLPTYGLYSAPADGSAAPVRLDPGDPGQLLSLQLDPDGDHVLFLVAGGLFRAPIDGSSPAQRLDQPETATADVTHYAVSPDGTRVVYRADLEVDNRFELWSVPVGGGPSTRLNGPMTTGGNIPQGTALGDPAFRIAADSATVVYVADQETDEVFELFSAPIAGGVPPTRIVAPLVPGGDVLGYDLTPDSSRVVSIADRKVDNRYDLEVVPIDGSAQPLLLNTPVGLQKVSEFQITPDHQRVVFLHGNLTAIRNLLVVPIAGGAETQLESQAMDFRVTPDSSRVIYTQGNADVLRTVPITGGTSVQLTPAGLQSGLGLVTPDSSLVAFTAGDDLYSAPSDGSSPATLISAPERRRVG